MSAPEPGNDRRHHHERLRTMDLTELGRHFGTDKVGRHHYTPHYERHLGHLRHQAFSLFEIGIGGGTKRKGGASLRMWKWFFPKAQIVGLDIVDKTYVRRGRIHPYVGSQTDRALLEQINAEHGPFQVIIDDGSHRNEHVRETFDILFPLLADDGIYVIEDTQTSYWPGYGGSLDLEEPSTMMAMVKRLVDGLNYEEFLDEEYVPTYTDLHVVGVFCYHNLVFIQKGHNNEGPRRLDVLRRKHSNAGQKGN